MYKTKIKVNPDRKEILMATGNKEKTIANHAKKQGRTQIWQQGRLLGFSSCSFQADLQTCLESDGTSNEGVMRAVCQETPSDLDPKAHHARVGH